MSLFDDELKTLINASAKIFPISQDMVDNSLNPDNYEYGKIERSIYRWSGTAWEYIVADDIDIDWSDINNKPTVFAPDVHTHSELHSHTNKSVIDTITQLLIDGWNSAVSHISDAIKHITAEERTLWNTVSGKADTTHAHVETDITDLDKYTKLETDNLLSDKAPSVHNHDDSYYTTGEVDTALSGKAPLSHDHDGRYYTESETNTLLGGKADLVHSHTDLHTHSNKSILDKIIETEPQTDYDLSQLQYVEDIRNGYTEGHTHSNKSILDSITQLLIDGWNSAVAHISDAIKHITGEERTLWNTVSSKADSTHNHDTDYADIAHSHVKADITDLGDLTVTWAGIADKPSTFPPEAHTHDDRYYTESEITTLLAGKAEASTLSGHTGNTTVHVTQTDKDKWNGKAEAVHTHTKSQITDFPTSLPANGGNADTINSFSLSDFIWTHSQRDFVDGTVITTNIDYAVSGGDPFILEIRGNSYGDQVPLDIQYQGYIYSDTIINHGGISNGYNITGLVALNVGGNLTFWFPRQSYWHGYRVRVFSAHAGNQKNRVTSITNGVKPSGTKEVALSNIKQSWHSGNFTPSSYLPLTGGTMTGILYPQNNTSYTTGQARRIVLSTADPSGGGNGDVWIKYTP